MDVDCKACSCYWSVGSHMFKKKGWQETKMKCFRGILGAPVMGPAEVLCVQYLLISLEAQVEEQRTPKGDLDSKKKKKKSKHVNSFGE